MHIFLPHFNFKASFLFSFLSLSFIGFGQQPPQLDFKIFDQQTEDNILIYASNKELLPVTVQIEIDYSGLKPVNALQEYVLIPEDSANVLVASFHIPKGTSWQFSYRTMAYEGNVFAEHNDNYAYALPFKTGEKFKLSQGYNGSYSHQGLNALDFTMPKGTTILAAREGKVVKVVEGSNKGCNHPKCLRDANYVSILHKDGTIATYSHLQFRGALVEPGDLVERGQIIAKCGQTGFASGPHLHFSVHKSTLSGVTTIPTKFLIAPDQAESLSEGKVYTAFEH